MGFRIQVLGCRVQGLGFNATTGIGAGVVYHFEIGTGRGHDYYIFRPLHQSAAETHGCKGFSARLRECGGFLENLGATFLRGRHYFITVYTGF